MKSILLADNNLDFLATRREYLEREGYHVIPASNPADARRVLERGDVDLAVIDIRLEDNDKEDDTSGLILAREVALSVPKIILTGFPAYKTVVDALKPQLKGAPTALDYVAKDEGPEAMLRAIQKALEFGNAWLRKTTDGIAVQLTEDYEDARRQSQMNYWASLIVALLGILVIFAGVALVLSNILAVGIASGVGGVVTEAISYLFFKRVDTANRRMDNYHSESLQTRRFENLLASCEAITIPEAREACKEKVINAARIYWFKYSRSEAAIGERDDTGK